MELKKNKMYFIEYKSKEGKPIYFVGRYVRKSGEIYYFWDETSEDYAEFSEDELKNAKEMFI